MIRDKQPLSMYEAGEILDSLKETDKTKETKAFLNKFYNTTPAKAKKIKAELEGLELIKLKRADIVKIIDVMPEDAVELNKIFTEVVLDADETNKILDTIKNNK